MSFTAAAPVALTFAEMWLARHIRDLKIRYHSIRGTTGLLEKKERVGVGVSYAFDFRLSGFV